MRMPHTTHRYHEERLLRAPLDSVVSDLIYVGLAAIRNLARFGIATVGRPAQANVTLLY